MAIFGVATNQELRDALGRSSDNGEADTKNIVANINTIDGRGTVTVN